MTIDGVPVAATVDDEDAPAQVISFDAEGLSTGTHVVYVKGTDAAGNWNATSFNVIVNPDYDVTDPEVIGQTPDQGSEDVAIMIHPVITFSEDMDPATVNSSTVQLREYDTGNPLLYGQLIVYDQDTDTASIQPLAMDYDTHYYIWVSGAKDLAGNPVEDYTDPDVSDFTTLAYTTYTTDIPSVASFLPGAGEEIGVTVGPDGNIISVTFDTSMYEQSLTTDTIKLWKVGEEEDTEVTNTTLVLVNANGLSNNVVKIIPAANLDYESAYYLTVADDVRSFSTGENMADDYTSDTFSTRAEETGALGVNNAIQVRYWGVPNGGYNNGWEWVLNITVPSDNNNFAMKFADWISGSHTLLVAGNMRYWSEEINEGELGSETNPVEITAADEYPDYISLDSDANSSPDAHGLQTNIHVQVKIPAGQSGGSYSTSYGIEIPD